MPPLGLGSACAAWPAGASLSPPRSPAAARSRPALTELLFLHLAGPRRRSTQYFFSGSKRLQIRDRAVPSPTAHDRFDSSWIGRGGGICCLVLISDSATLLLLSRPGLLKFGVLGFLLLVCRCAASPISEQILVTGASFLPSVLEYSSRCHVSCRLWRSKSSFGIDASVVSSCSVVGLGLICSSSGVKANRVLC